MCGKCGFFGKRIPFLTNSRHPQKSGRADVGAQKAKGPLPLRKAAPGGWCNPVLQLHGKVPSCRQAGGTVTRCCRVTVTGLQAAIRSAG